MSDQPHLEYLVASTCPLPNTHRRLERAHKLWHDALENYDELDEFVPYLNGTITTLREVTFMLQKEQSQITDFKSWYGIWQESAKANPTLSWLHDARTTVVHKSDLALTSIARVTVFNNRTHVIGEMDAPPMASTPTICDALAKRVPDEYRDPRDSLVLAVERTWRVAELGERELLDALAEAYGNIRTLVVDAHNRIGTICNEGIQRVGVDGKLSCMRVTEVKRTVRMSLKDGAWIGTKRRAHTIYADDVAVESRYGAMTKVAEGASLEEQALAIFEAGKRMMEIDGFHTRFVHLFVEQKSVQLVLINATDRSSKFAMMRDLASEVRRYNADALIDIAEAWQAPLQEMENLENIEEAPSRMEVLQAILFQRDGKSVQFDCSVERDSLGNTHCGPTVRHTDPWPVYLTPIADAWGLSISE